MTEAVEILGRSFMYTADLLSLAMERSRADLYTDVKEIGIRGASKLVKRDLAIILADQFIREHRGRDLEANPVYITSTWSSDCGTQYRFLGSEVVNGELMMWVENPYGGQHRVTKVEFTDRFTARFDVPKCEHGNVEGSGCRDTAGCTQQHGHPGSCRIRYGTLSIHTAGLLHGVPDIQPTFTFSLSDLLDDPAHKPDADLVKLDGTDYQVQDFVFSTEGAQDLYADMVRTINRQLDRGKDVTVLVLCQGGRHRSVAFGENLGHQFMVTPTHHHKHRPIVSRSR